MFTTSTRRSFFLAARQSTRHSGAMSSSPVHVSLQASPEGGWSWTELARRCEDAGLRALLVSDHPGNGPSPFVALAAAASVTTTLRLGGYVLNAGVRDPLFIAADAATLDVVSEGRAEVGIGAGHTPAEWEMTGRARPPAPERVQHLMTVAAAVRALLDGQSVPADTLGTLRDVTLDEPRPIQQRVPLLIGGNNPDLLAWAGQHADAVGLSGLGRTLPDGHRHTVSWSTTRTDQTVTAVRSGAARGGRDVPPREALVQMVAVTNDRASAVAAFAEDFQLSAEDALAAPYLWIGTTQQIVEQLHAARERWGITRWVVRADALEAARDVITHL